MKLKSSCIKLLSVLSMITFFSSIAYATKGVEIYTPNTKLSVAPGESLTYKLQVINHSAQTELCNLSISGIPKTWSYTLKSGAYNIKQVAVLPNEKQTLQLQIEIPLKVNKGNYPISIYAGSSKLPLVINISKQGSYKTEFTTDQANMQGHANADFSFKTNLKNRTGEKQLYALRSKAPRGWSVTFKPNYKQATAVEVEPNGSKDITIDIKAPQNANAGTYKIPIAAVNNLSSDELELEVVVTGTYEMELTTPTGLLSTKITSGSKKELQLLISNRGSSTLNNIKLSASKPSGWEVKFEPEEIQAIEPGKKHTVNATIKADKKAIAGDYVANITAKVPEVSSKATFRISVKTPIIWGWIGIIIIIMALGSVVYLFRKYGRR